MALSVAYVVISTCFGKSRLATASADACELWPPLPFQSQPMYVHPIMIRPLSSWGVGFSLTSRCHPERRYACCARLVKTSVGAIEMPLLDGSQEETPMRSSVVRPLFPAHLSHLSSCCCSDLTG